MHPKDLSAALGYVCQLRNIDLDCSLTRHGGRREQAVIVAMGVRNRRRAPRTEAEILGMLDRFHRWRRGIA